MKQTNDESKQQATMEQKDNDKQAVKDKQREAALQEGNKNVIAAAKTISGVLKNSVHGLHRAKFSLRPILQIAAKLLPGINKRGKAKTLSNKERRGDTIGTASREEILNATAIPAETAVSNSFAKGNEAVDDQQVRQRKATNNTDKRNAIMGNAILAAKAKVPTTNNKLLKSDSRYAVVAVMPATVKSSGRLNDVPATYGVLRGMRGVNTAAANEARVNPDTARETVQQIWEMRQGSERTGVYKNHMQVVNGLRSFNYGGASIVYKQRNGVGAVGIIEAVTTNQMKGTKPVARLLRTNSMQTKSTVGAAGIQQPATFLKHEPVELLHQAKGMGEKMTGNSIDAAQHANRKGESTTNGRQVALHMTQPMIGSLTIHCATTTDAVTDIGNKVEEALLAILESANAIH